MDRTLQSSLEKRTRVGAWSTRVYRLERGFLSAWADVAKVAAKEDPSRTECLFQGNQVAKVTDQGDRRLKLEFPWDSAKNLQLRANSIAMKRAWMDVLNCTLKEAAAQIQGTGSVFAYGGAAHHEKDQAYEEAAFLQTNRFVAAYVVDEHSRMSYVNDILNEGFHQPGEHADGGRDLYRACVGANTAIEEFLALIQDFDHEMQGLEKLRRDQVGNRGGLDGTVAAPKIQRFCEGYIALVGRLIASRLMLELSPFMDSSVAETPSAPISSSRKQLIATRRKLDEAYAAAEQQIVLGTRDWFMDIRGSLLDCKGLATVSSEPPRCRPTSKVNALSDTEAISVETPTSALVNSSSQTMLGAPTPSPINTNMSMEPSVKAPESEDRDDFVIVGVEQEKQTRTLSSIMNKSGRGGGWPMRSVFRRGSRSEKEQEPSTSSRSTPAFKHGQDEFGSTSTSRTRSAVAEKEGREMSDILGGSSRSPSKSPLSTRRLLSRNVEEKASPLPNGDESHKTLSTASVADAPTASVNYSPTREYIPAFSPSPHNPEGGRKSRRAFAGGFWNKGGESVSTDDAHDDRTRSSASALGETVSIGVRAVEQASPPAVDVADGTSHRDAPHSIVVKPSGGKRRFAGGVFSAPAPASSLGIESSGSIPGNSRENTANRITGASSVTAASKNVSMISHLSVEPVPAWAAGADQNDPKWAGADSKASGASGVILGGDKGKTGGFGVAPPSRPDQGQGPAEKSPFMTAEAPAPAVRRPSQRRGESGRAKRAFGGGQPLF